MESLSRLDRVIKEIGFYRSEICSVVTGEVVIDSVLVLFFVFCFEQRQRLHAFLGDHCCGILEGNGPSNSTGAQGTDLPTWSEIRI